jgi:hypothetical protein
MKKPYPITRWPLPEAIRLLEDVYLEMRDGVRIATDVYLPRKEGRYPVILAMCPYKKEAQAAPPQAGFHSEGGNPAFFVPKGYAMVFASVRGAGKSQGRFNFLGPVEQRDGYDIVERIAEQPWCDGNIGMFGGSYLGMSQYYVAAQRPPHLRCITPVDACTDLYRDFVYQAGGMFHRAFMSLWGPNLVDELLYPGPVDGKLPPPDLFGDWISNYLDGPYYRERSAIHYLDRIEVPVMTILSAHGRLHNRGHLLGLHRIKSLKKLIVGPSAGTQMMFQMYSMLCWDNERTNRYVLRWLDHWLKGIDTGMMEEPLAVLFDDATGEWRYENELPPFARTEWTRFYLRSNPSRPAEPPQGLLSRAAPASDEPPDRFETKMVLGAPVNVLRPPLAYVSKPFDTPTRIGGPLSAELHGSAKAPDTSLWAWFVRIGDLAPDGTLTLLTKGCLKASMREVDGGRSKPWQPWHPFRNKEVLESDRVYDFRIEILPVFHTFKAGHRLWLQIAGDDPDFKIDNYSDLVPGPLPIECTVYHDPERPSFVLLPIVPDAPVEQPVAEPLF